MVDWLTDPVMCSCPFVCLIDKEGLHAVVVAVAPAPGTQLHCVGGRWAMGTVDPLPVHLSLPLRVGWSGKLELLSLMVGWWEALRALMGPTEQRALPGTNALRFDHRRPLSIISFLPSFFFFVASISIPPLKFLSRTTQWMHCIIRTL